MTSKTFGFLKNRLHALCFCAGLACGAVSLFPALAQQSITAERINEHIVLFTLDGKKYMGFDLEASKPLKQAETNAKEFKVQLDLCHADLQKAKDNEQELKVARSRIERDYDAQSTLLTSCMALSKNGPKSLRDWRIDLALKAAPTVTGLLKRCN